MENKIFNGADNILEIKNLSVKYDNQYVLKNISFSLQKGDELAVIGPNGSGKTTILKAMLKAIPYEGEIVFGENVKIGYVPQKIDLERNLPITVKDFFTLNKRTPFNLDLYKETLGLVDLPKTFLKKKFSELSSGEFQRALIAWALIGKPNLLLFDEPTASVDIEGQELIYELLHRLEETRGITLILISHDLTVVYRYATKVLCLNHSQTCFGYPKDVLTTESLEKLYGGSKKFYQHN